MRVQDAVTASSTFLHSLLAKVLRLNSLDSSRAARNVKCEICVLTLSAMVKYGVNELIAITISIGMLNTETRIGTLHVQGF